jgi:dTDP-L-rhamnose 4-epimerase
MEIKHILITGGAGFIGSNLANFLVSKGQNIRVFDNLSPQIHGVDSQNSYLFKSLNKNIEFIKGTIKEVKLDQYKRSWSLTTVI